MGSRTDRGWQESGARGAHQIPAVLGRRGSTSSSEVSLRPRENPASIPEFQKRTRSRRFESLLFGAPWPMRTP
jgi:hypothetical protein